MEENDKYWLAGFLEGEGSFLLHRQGRDLRITVGGTDLDIIERAQRIMGARAIGARLLPSGKTFYRVTISNQADADRIMRAVQPLMGERRAAKIAECLAAHDLIPAPKRDWTHCKSGHPLIGANLRVVSEGKYFKRRCIECGRLRQQKYRAKAA